MNDQQMQTLLDTWYRDREIPGPKVQTSVANVMARVPQTRQRGRWWPLPLFRRKAQTPTATDTAEYQPSPIPATNGHAPTVIGRTQTMFSPVKAITAGALVFAIGGVLLIAQPFDQQEAGVPGAATEEGIGEVTPFEGEMRYGSTSVPGVTEVLPNGVATYRGQVWTLTDVEMSDPRLEGTVSNMWNWDQIMRGDQHNVYVGGFRIENPDGAWQMRPVVNLKLPDGTWTVWTAIFDGEGDYEGLTAIAEVTEQGRFTLRGIIIDGEIPPPPESMSTE